MSIRTDASRAAGHATYVDDYNTKSALKGLADAVKRIDRELKALSSRITVLERRK